MITAEQNDFMTRVGPDQPAGKLLRRYWQPVALAEELDGPRPVKGVRLLGQDLVLFRDDNGKLGLLDRDCPHRGADLAFGRLEDGGLRCAFHGWLFDVEGKCLETPAEPANSRFKDSIQQGAYPVVERSGIIFAYLGEGEPPAFPEFDCFVAPDTHVFAFKGLWECNWLQALEVGIDPAHASFLHRFFQDEDPTQSYGKQFRSTSSGSETPITKVLREYERPTINVNLTDYGMRLTTLRELDEEHTHVRVTNMVFPQAIVIPMSTHMTISQWHVPIDDTHCYWYAIFTSFTEPVNKEQMRQQRLELYELPNYTSRKNKSNNYGFDPQEQASETYTGMGYDINVHDQWAVESQGPIQDRTREHLAASDKGVYAYRRMLVKAIEATLAGEGKVPMVLTSDEAPQFTGPTSVDGIASASEADNYLEQADLKRRQQSDWASQRLVAKAGS